MLARIVSQIADVPAHAWNALQGAEHPFARHEFLAALESTGCVGPDTGWTPSHLLLENETGELEGAIPLYRKAHSWGEFVFDWSWARAWSQAGLSYYPKLVSMAPFTPAAAPRLLVAGPEPAAARRQLIAALRDFTIGEGCSSSHALFLEEADREAFQSAGFLLRKDCQFHWTNRGWRTFDEFVGALRAEKRKKLMRERRRVTEAGVDYATYAGAQMDRELWRTAFAYSAATFAAHGHEHYLNVEFFEAVCAAMPEAVMVKFARHRGRAIAAAIFFRSAATLYGRYWGAADEYHSLHFETCYHQGVEYCIEQGLERFEPGTQGEHKVPRGFEPASTWSAHLITDQRFARAIGAYLRQEQSAVDEYMREVAAHTPFRREGEVAGGPR